MNALLITSAIILGGIIGAGFGILQNNALRKHKQLEKSGKLTNGWGIMPGSMQRVFYLLVLLIGIQLVCPMLFTDSTTQWLISAGIVIGYGWVLTQRIRVRERISS